MKILTYIPTVDSFFIITSFEDVLKRRHHLNKRWHNDNVSNCIYVMTWYIILFAIIEWGRNINTVCNCSIAPMYSNRIYMPSCHCLNAECREDNIWKCVSVMRRSECGSVYQHFLMMYDRKITLCSDAHGEKKKHYLMWHDNKTV